MTGGTDAARRDFTINAMSMARDGDGVRLLRRLTDLHAGVVRFVGDPATRIAEDYLRILRFFRFFARYGASAARSGGAGGVRGRYPGSGRPVGGAGVERAVAAFWPRPIRVPPSR